MAYKFQKGAAHLDGLISGSSTAVFESSLSSSGDLAVTGAVHAAQLYGGGAGITGISADAIDVTSSAADVAYNLVFTEGAQTDGSLGLALNTALNYNPSDAIISSSAKLQVVGNSIFGGQLNVSGVITAGGKLNSTSVLSSSQGFESVVFLRTAGALQVSGAATMAAVSSSGQINAVGTINTIGAINTSGAMTATSFSTTDITYGDSAIVIDSDGGNFTINQEDADKAVRISLGATDASTSGFQIRKASGAKAWSVLDTGFVSGSGVLYSVGSISSSGDLAVTGAVHAAQFYGGGAGITGISSDAVDVTASLGGSQVYGIVGTEAIQSDGTLGLITTVSGASFNPLDAAWGSKLLLSGNVAGLQASQIQFGEKAGIGMIDDDGLMFVISSSLAGIDISASHDAGISLYAGDGEDAGLFIVSAGESALWVGTADETAAFTVAGSTGNLSGSGTAQFVGASIFGNNLSVSGTFTSKGDTQLAAAGVGTTVNGDLTVAQPATFQDTISGSSTLEIVGNARFVGNLGVSGAISLDDSGGGINFDGGSNVMKITNNGGSTMGFGGGSFAFNNLISGSGALQIVGNGMIGGDLDVSGGMTIGDSSDDVAVFKATAYFAGPEKHKLATITANTELTASAAASYQIVSGGTSALTVTLPSASNGDYSYMVKRHSLMSGNVVITGSGGDDATQLIDGNASITLATVGASVFLISDGTQWSIF